MAAKLLLVEDSMSIQTIVETTFPPAGFEVVVAGDALEGLRKAQTWLPDIVLADAAMPGLDGFQLCQRIRHSANGRQIPVVLLTSGFAAYDHGKGERVGVTAHVAKPFEPQVLLQLVRQLVPEAPGHAPGRPDLMTGPRVRASDLVPEPPSEAVPVRPTAEAALATEAVSGHNGTPHEAVPTPHATAPEVDREESAGAVLCQMLGQHVLHMVRDTLEAHLATTLTQLTPHILNTVREVVHAQMPDLLARLLQQEIAKLKQAVEQDQHYD